MEIKEYTTFSDATVEFNDFFSGNRISDFPAIFRYVQVTDGGLHSFDPNIGLCEKNPETPSIPMSFSSCLFLELSENIDINDLGFSLVSILNEEATGTDMYMYKTHVFSDPLTLNAEFENNVDNNLPNHKNFTLTIIPSKNFICVATASDAEDIKNCFPLFEDFFLESFAKK